VGGFLDRTEAKRRTTAAGSPKGERSESIDRIGEILRQDLQDFSGDYRMGDGDVWL
jgi:hypothetical protein